ISTPEDRTSSMFSVQRTEEGSQSTFFRATLRFRMCVRRRWVFERSQRSLATELPTVPKPIKATLQFCAPSFCASTFCVPTSCAPTTALFLAESSLGVPGIPSPVLRTMALWGSGRVQASRASRHSSYYRRRGNKQRTQQLLGRYRRRPVFAYSLVTVVETREFSGARQLQLIEPLCELSPSML